jgi:hypothetical protein
VTLFHADDLAEAPAADMARALVIGLATMMAKNGTKKPALKTASSEGYLAIVAAVEKCLSNSAELKEELNILRRRGPERYLKYATSDIRKEIRGSVRT